MQQRLLISLSLSIKLISLGHHHERQRKRSLHVPQKTGPEKISECRPVKLHCESVNNPSVKSCHTSNKVQHNYPSKKRGPNPTGISNKKVLLLCCSSVPFDTLAQVLFGSLFNSSEKYDFVSHHTVRRHVQWWLMFPGKLFYYFYRVALKPVVAVGKSAL